MALLSDLKKLSYDILAKLNKPDQRDKDLAQLSEIMGWEEDIVLPPHQIVLDESKTFYDIKTRTIHFEFKIELL